LYAERSTEEELARVGWIVSPALTAEEARVRAGKAGMVGPDPSGQEVKKGVTIPTTFDAD